MAKGKLRIKSYRRKSFIKDVIPGRGVKRKRIKATRVKSHLRPDKGKPGRTPKAKRWFKPKATLHGWSKDLSANVRRARASIGRSDLSSARALIQLANVTTDRETKRVARDDAKYFFAKHKSR